MYVIIPNGKLKKGDPFPMINLPVDIKGESYKEFKLDDYQWWAYSKSFNDWFKSSGRSWQASESSVNTEADALIEKWKSEKFDDGKPIMRFNDFLKESIQNEIFEDGEEGGGAPAGGGTSAGTGITQEQQIKFLYAYNKLLKEGAIQEEFDTNTEFETGSEKAFFISLDLNDPEEKALNVKALKLKSREGFSSGAGKLASGNEMYPGPVEIPKDAKSNYIVTVIQQDLSSLGGWASGMLASWGIYSIAAALGAPYLAYRVFNGWKFSSAVAAIGQAGGPGAAKTIADLLRGGRSVKKGSGIFGRIGRMGNFVFKEGLGLKKGYQFASKAWKFGSKLKTTSRVLNAGKAFFRGVGAAGVRVIPVWGWALAAVDAVGSLINWYSDNQAPRPGEAQEAFDAKLEFSPTMVNVGESIVICWSQPDDTAWGNVLSFLVSNMGETRTIMELTKILDDEDGYSLFVLQSANSESLNQQIKGNLITLVGISNSTLLKQGITDNPSFDGRICAVNKQETDEEGDAIPVPLNFEGACNWETLVNAVNEADGVMFKSDPNAPETYEWNFEDMDGDRINVIGKLVTDDDLASLTNEDIERIFYSGKDTGNAKKDSKAPEAEPEEEEIEAEEEFNESMRVVKFDDFKDGKLYEEDGEGGDSISDGFTGPALLAIYVCDGKNSKAYANKEAGEKKRLPIFTNFSINADDYSAKPGDSIDVTTNSDEDIEDPKAGYAEYREGSEVERNPETEAPSDGTGEEGEDAVQAGGGKISAPDITKKERKHSTVIKDKDVDGGVNIAEEFLTPEDKKTLGIPNWDKITMIKARYDDNDEISKIILRNKDAQFMDKSRDYSPGDGDSFEIAKKLLKSAQSQLEVKK